MISVRANDPQRSTIRQHQALDSKRQITRIIGQHLIHARKIERRYRNAQAAIRQPSFMQPPQGTSASFSAEREIEHSPNLPRIGGLTTADGRKPSAWRATSSSGIGQNILARQQFFEVRE